MAQPDISSILAALAHQNQNGTPQASATPQHPPPSQPPSAYPGVMPTQPPSAPPAANPYLPQPSSAGSIDLSSIKPVNSGSVSIQDAIAKAKSIAADKGVQPWDPRQAADPRLSGRDYGRSRSRSPPRRDRYNDNPYRDERREDPRRGSYRHSPSPERNIRGSRDPPSGYRSNDSDTETIRIKSSLVGLVIGRNGENLRRIESETTARVQFLQAKGSHVQEREATISGPLHAREGAKNAIFGIIEENGGTNIPQEKGAYTAGMPGRAKVNLPALREGENSVQIMVPDKTVGLIIGRGGETIKELQEKSGCHVNIVGENKSVNGFRPVNLIGSDRATAYARELINEIVESDNQPGGGTRGGAGSNAVQALRDRGFNAAGSIASSNGRDHVEKTIHVPSEAVGMIIGKGGETIKEMQRQTGCKINVNQPKGNDVKRAIDLSGTARSMADAETKIWDKVETVQQRDAAAGRLPRGAGIDDGAYGGYSQQQTQAPPAIPGYGSYMPPPSQGQTQAPPQMPAFQMPMPSAPPAAQEQQQQQIDPQYAHFYAQWYAQQLANAQQGGHMGAPGTQ